ncbi:membrane protein insertase YidC [Alphaproteobacteria bacterium]|nr:membrane protein insertase YidC [Alphaproteobacteria bacterium]MDB2370872.1 membrane protein insertase YidC [Alphaproteobacteria bacterium]
MENQKNLFLAIIISMAIIFGFQLLVPQPERTPVTEDTNTQNSVSLDIQGATSAILLDRDQVLEETIRVTFDNSKIKGSINLEGGIIDDLVLEEYRETLDPTSDFITYLNPLGSQDAYYLDTGWVSPDSTIELPNNKSVWKADKTSIGMNDPVKLTWQNSQNITFEKIITLDEHYLFSVDQRVINNSGKSFDLYPFGLSKRQGIPEMENFFILHEGPLSITDSVLKEYDYDDLKDKKKIKLNSVGGWIGMTDKYWQTAIISDQNEPIQQTYSYSYVENTDNFQTDLVGTKIVVGEGDNISHNLKLFAGPKIVSVIDQYMDEYGVQEFDRSVDFGWFYFLTKPIFHVLEFIFGYVGNFGWAIIIFTLLMRICFFPLAQASFKSMAKMKKLGPELQRLKEQYGDDRAGMQKEMMALYKREKANPIAGCLPILLQIPVFFALYKVLFVTIEMRHAPFIGWISDLSAPDPLGLLTLFGFVDWNVPGILQLFNIGIWPILMGISMFLQQKLNPAPVDKMQAKIFMFLPIVFTFVLGGFAAGLVIYWTTNNVLSMAQQYVIQRKIINS